MARLLFLSVGVFFAVIMLILETKGLPLTDNSPVLTLAEVQQGFIRMFQEQKKCKKLGERCHVAEECCSKRCLSFAAKCVT
uniref:Venom polypeptide n=1 Tax=Dolopus genitalis TaxID=2488630 RepID=A0A3G5BIE4_DOLGE|nr:venom polypeptide [Dolopus genitalis]